MLKTLGLLLAAHQGKDDFVVSHAALTARTYGVDAKAVALAGLHVLL